MPLTANDAIDIIFDSYRLEAFVAEHGGDRREAIRILCEIMDTDDTPIEPQRMSWARAANLRFHPTARRQDVEQLVTFAENVGRLPNRVRDVYLACILEGRTRRECARELGISVETVRSHLRRLRMYVRTRGSLSPGFDPEQ